MDFKAWRAALVATMEQLSVPTDVIDGMHAPIEAITLPCANATRRLSWLAGKAYDAGDVSRATALYQLRDDVQDFANDVAASR